MAIRNVQYRNFGGKQYKAIKVVQTKQRAKEVVARYRWEGWFARYTEVKDYKSFRLATPGKGMEYYVIWIRRK